MSSRNFLRIADPVTAARAREVTERALATGAAAPKGRVLQQALEESGSIFAALWLHLESEAESRGVDAKNGLLRRGRKESDEPKTLLDRQQKETDKDLTELQQLTLEQVQDKQQRRQVELDISAIKQRQKNFASQLEEEPKKIEALYDVQMTRLSPVGLVLAWPGE